jgi:hypothetical protein
MAGWFRVPFRVNPFRVNPNPRPTLVFAITSANFNIKTGKPLKEDYGAYQSFRKNT